MDSDDIVYYRKRAEQEQERARLCEDGAAAQAHWRMASEYNRLVREHMQVPQLVQTV